MYITKLQSTLPSVPEFHTTSGSSASETEEDSQSQLPKRDADESLSLTLDLETQQPFSTLQLDSGPPNVNLKSVTQEKNLKRPFPTFELHNATKRSRSKR